MQFECCGTVNFTDWQVADLSLHDDDGVPNNSSSSINNGVHGNGNWSLSVPDSCCIKLLDHDGCGWDVMNDAESRLNNIHNEARLLYLTIAVMFMFVAAQGAWYIFCTKLRASVSFSVCPSVCDSYSDSDMVTRQH